jgi:hypothetical protein
VRHVAADADGVPLGDDDPESLASAQEAPRLDGAQRVAVLGIPTTRHYPVTRVRAAIADARDVWRVVADASR